MAEEGRAVEVVLPLDQDLERVSLRAYRLKVDEGALVVPRGFPDPEQAVSFRISLR